VTDYEKAKTQFVKLVASIPNLSISKHQMPYTQIGSVMMSFLTPEGDLCLRLPEEDVHWCRNCYRTTHVELNGKEVEGFARIPATELSNQKDIKFLMERSYYHTKKLAQQNHR